MAVFCRCSSCTYIFNIKSPLCVGYCSFAPSSVKGRLSMSWLYEEVARQWSHWLPANQTGFVRRGAFYSVLFKPGLRVISINTNFCNDKNWCVSFGWWRVLNFRIAR